MKKILLFLVATLLVTGPNMFGPYTATAQVAIGGDGTVTPGALLDLSQATDAGGLLLPQIVSADTATAVLKKPGMLVYNKTDGKIYAYNGSAWSAGGGSGGSGGGGSEPEPTPSPTSCSGSVMGVSGNEYPIGSYPYAQNDLKNLCWTLSNLKEAGQAATANGAGDSRGYYYGPTAVINGGGDVCQNGLGYAWRLPTTFDMGLLLAGFVDLTYEEKSFWTQSPNGGGGLRELMTTSGTGRYSWIGVNEYGFYLGMSAGLGLYNDDDLTKNFVRVYPFNTGANPYTHHELSMAPVRCVRYI
ncbi:MAG: hypothetical protein LBN93_00595 [Candidatus Symbiothrix sp.]|nr:hypothetical protein [Candidatus Symbiothrix sp.]